MLFRTINYSVINYLGFILTVINDLDNLLILPICTFVFTLEVLNTTLSCDAAENQVNPGQLHPENSKLSLTHL